jgi:hypothetical protein
MQLVAYGFSGAKTKDTALAHHYLKVHLTVFPESPDLGAFWRTDHGYSQDELDKIFNKINAPKDNNLAQNATVSIVEEASAAKSDYQPKQNITFQGNYNSRGYFYIYTEKPETIKIGWIFTNSKGDAASATISGADKTYKAVYDYSLTSSNGKVSVSIPAGESSFFINASPNTTYTLQLQTNNAFCYFEPSPWGKMTFLNEKGVPNYGPPHFPTYIYIPKNIAEVQYKVQGNQLKILAPDGTLVSTEVTKQLDGGQQIRSFRVPPNFSGKFWQAVIPGIYSYQFLNIPDRYFLLIPK